MEQTLLPKNFRLYSKRYWESRKLAPSALLITIGVNKKVPGLSHHTLFFQNDWQESNKALFDVPSWPKQPLFYASTPSKTDPSVAPKGQELITILIPLHAGLADSSRSRKQITEFVLNQMEQTLEFPLRSSIVFQQSYGINDFSSDFNAYKGNAYGLGHIWSQTALFRPKLKSPKIRNLFYTGQFTTPGIGVPMVAISGHIVAVAIRHEYTK